MYSIIDIESNGAAYRQESIIEIAIFRYDGHKITDQFISLVNPESDITPFVQKLTNISPKMVKSAPKFHELAKRIVEITENTILVGHNIDFDYRMLRQSFKRLGYDFTIPVLDTIPLAKKLLPDEESYSLSKLAKSLGIPLTNAHRADGDARATLDLFKLLIAKDIDSDVIQMLHEETNANSYVNKMKKLTQDLPNEKGFLYFQNEAGEILFTDFVEDINKAAKKIFNAKNNKWKQIQKNVSQIHFELTGSVLIAKLFLNSKRMNKREKLPFALLYKNQNYSIDKSTTDKQNKPLLRFKSYTQAQKALQYIISEENLKDREGLLSKINFANKNELWVSNGRKRGEKLFITIEKGVPTGFGFFELYTQIQHISTIQKLKIPLTPLSIPLKNELQLALLMDYFDRSALPKME